MARIKIKRGSGVPTGLTFGELAFDTTNKRLYLGITSGTELLTSPQGGVASINGATGAINGIARTDVDNIFTTGQSVSAVGGYWSVDDAQNFTIVSPAYIQFYDDFGTYNQTLYRSPGGQGNVFLPSTSGTLALVGSSVASFNGLTGAVSGVTTSVANTFTALQTFNAGITAAGATLGNLKMRSVGGAEGGQIDFELAGATFTSLSGGVAIDIYQNKMRFFETGGSARGYYLDLTAASNGVGSAIGISPPGATGATGPAGANGTNGTDGTSPQDFLLFNLGII